MVTRPYIKKTTMNYFVFGKKRQSVRKRVRKRKRKRKRTYLGRGTTVNVLHPYFNRRNRLMLVKGTSADRYLFNNNLHLLKIVGSWQVPFIDV